MEKRIINRQKPYYLCFSLPLYMHLKQCGLAEVDSFPNPRPEHIGKIVWRFANCEQLSDALQLWTDTKPNYNT